MDGILLETPTQISGGTVTYVASSSRQFGPEVVEASINFVDSLRSQSRVESGCRKIEQELGSIDQGRRHS
jgi:hypothetical protein